MGVGGAEASIVICSPAQMLVLPLATDRTRQKTSPLGRWAVGTARLLVVDTEKFGLLKSDALSTWTS